MFSKQFMLVILKQHTFFTVNDVAGTNCPQMCYVNFIAIFEIPYDCFHANKFLDISKS